MFYKIKENQGPWQLFSVGWKLPFTPDCNYSDVLHIRSFGALNGKRRLRTGVIREDQVSVDSEMGEDGVQLNSYGP